MLDTQSTNGSDEDDLFIWYGLDGCRMAYLDNEDTVKSR
jgi:hypothetical protein